MMTIDRRSFGLGAAALGGATLLGGGASAQGLASALANLKPASLCGPGGEGALRGGHAVLGAERRLAAFTEATGINVKYTYVPFANMREALAAEMVGGTGDYDVVVPMDQWIPSLANLMDPMDARITEKKIDLNARYPKAYMQIGNVGGKQLGLPTRAHVQLLFYRKDLLAKHNIAVPKTWEQVVAAARTIQEKETGISASPCPTARTTARTDGLVQFPVGPGRRRVRREGPASLRDGSRPEGDAGICRPAAHPQGDAGRAVSFNEQDAVNSVKNGNSAMIPVWWWVRGQLIDPKTSKLTRSRSASRRCRASRAASLDLHQLLDLALTRNAKRKDAAMEFITYVTDPALERDILVDPKENDVVATQWSNLRDPEVNRRFGGMHNFAAEACRPRRPCPTRRNGHRSWKRWRRRCRCGSGFRRQERQRTPSRLPKRASGGSFVVADGCGPFSRSRERRWQAKPDG